MAAGRGFPVAVRDARPQRGRLGHRSGDAPAAGGWRRRGVGLRRSWRWSSGSCANTSSPATPRCSYIAAYTGHEFVFPEVGATFLLRSIVRLALALGVDGIEMMRALACACGGAAIWLLLRVARELAPEASAATIALLLLSGGLARVFAGRIEVYAPLLVAVLAYLVVGVARAAGNRTSALPALCLGLAIWLHAAAALLVPSLLAIGVLQFAAAAGARRVARSESRSLLLAGAPLAGFLVVQGLVAGTASALGAWTRVLEILGRGSETGGTRWWVRGWGGAPSIGTDVVWLSRAHLKYLLNAFSLLVPAASAEAAVPAAAAAARARRGSAGALARDRRPSARPLRDCRATVLGALGLGSLRTHRARARVSLRPGPRFAAARAGARRRVRRLPALFCRHPVLVDRRREPA